MIAIGSLFFVCIFCGLCIQQSRAKLICTEVGDCVPCTIMESSEEYCQATGKKARLVCKGSGSKVDEFRSCSSTTADDQMHLLLFLGVMGIIGGLAYMGVHSRKMQNMTRFETRKQRSVA